MCTKKINMHELKLKNQDFQKFTGQTLTKVWQQKPGQHWRSHRDFEAICAEASERAKFGANLILPYMSRPVECGCGRVVLCGTYAYAHVLCLQRYEIAPRIMSLTPYNVFLFSMYSYIDFSHQVYKRVLQYVQEARVIMY